MSERSESKKTLITVLGMHRSGTSALAGLIAHLGVELSDNLVPPQEDNPKGFFEHADIWRLDHELLKALGSDWDDPGPLPDDWQRAGATAEVAAQIAAILERDFSAASLAAVKDPRMCRLMPMWRDLAARQGRALKVAWIVRDPGDVAASLAKRDRVALDQALWVWLRYNLEAEQKTRDLPRILVRYESLLDDWRRVATDIAAALDLRWPLTLDAASSDVDAFLEPGLRHHHGQTDLSTLREPLRGWVEQVRAALSAGDGAVASTFGRIGAQIAEFDERTESLWTMARRLRLDYDGLQQSSQRTWQDLQWHVNERAQLQDEMQRSHQSRAEVQAELDRLLQSRSWRITRPLRWGTKQLRRMRGGGSAEQGAVIVDGQGPATASTSPSNEKHVGAKGSADYTSQSDPGASSEGDIPSVEAERPGNILIVSPDLIGPVRNGGIGTAFTALAQHLASVGHRVTVLYTLGDYCEDGTHIEDWVRHYQQQSIRLLPLRAEKHEPKLDAPWYCWHAYRVYRWLKTHSEEFSVAYFPEWRGEAYYALLAKQTGVAFEGLRFVVITHSPTVWAEGGNYHLPPRLDEVDLEFMERKVVEMADWVVSPSQYLIDWMRQRGWTLPANTRVIQNLLPFSFNPSAPVTATPAGVCEWVFFGRLEARKGLNIFIDALSRLDPERRARHRITFLGKAIASDQFDSIRYIRERLGDTHDSVRIITGYDRDQALAYLREPGRVAVIASLIENSPYTVLECLVEGIPFVAADVGGIAELIHADDRERALFAPTPPALAGMLARLDTLTYQAPRPAMTPESTRQAWLAFQKGLTDEPHAHVEPSLGAPYITVCLTHYERPGMLATAIESLRRQTYKHFEVVLVDDGSASGHACAYLESLEPEFERRGWRIIRQENAYLGAARNTAVEHARGEYVLFMDDDNIAKPQELAVFARAAARTQADILTAVSDVFHADASAPAPEESVHLWIPLGGAAGLGVFRNAFGDANALVRKTTFERVGGYTEDYGIGHEDWEFFARAVLSGARLVLVPEPLFWYRVGTDSMLQSGQAAANHARSVRPYQEMLPDGLGASLAYALHMHRKLEFANGGFQGPQPGIGSVFRAATRAFNPVLRAKFTAVRRQYGWRVAVGRAIGYTRRDRQ